MTNSCEQIHETVIRDIVDVISDAKNADMLKGVFSKNSFSSIAKASSNLTLTFPVVVSSANKIENSAMVAKAHERKMVSMLQMLFSAINVTSGDGADYIKQFHTNLKVDNGLDIEEFMDIVDRHVVEHENAGYQITDRELYNSIKEDFKNLNHTLPDILSEKSVNDYLVKENHYSGSIYVTEKGLNYSDENSIRKAKDLLTGIKYDNEMKKMQILDTDVKKANELVPTMMIVNFVSLKDGTALPGTLVVGVKAKMILVESQDIINRVISKNKDGNGFNTFIRATTREISFLKDFVFAIDKAKIDALSTGSMRSSSSKIWKLLERRALKGRIRKYLSAGSNDASAITTLTMSKDEVEFLKKTENIDMEKVNTAKQIMEAYNLIAIIIVDEAMELVKFLYDDDSSSYETLTFNHLERETSDGGYKKVINLMTKMSR